jgi:hypothetical protein
VAGTSGDTPPAAERGDREQAGGDKSDLGLYPLEIAFEGVTIRAQGSFRANFRKDAYGVSVAVDPRRDALDTAAKSARREGAAGEIHERIGHDGTRQLVAYVRTPDGSTSTTVAWDTPDGVEIEHKWGLPSDQPKPPRPARRDQPGMPPPPDFEAPPPFGFTRPGAPETPP